jgi:hypothetical protein
VSNLHLRRCIFQRRAAEEGKKRRSARSERDLERYGKYAGRRLTPINADWKAKYRGYPSYRRLSACIGGSVDFHRNPPQTAAETAKS